MIGTQTTDGWDSNQLVLFRLQSVAGDTISESVGFRLSQETQSVKE
jgi:hypothetical protein